MVLVTDRDVNRRKCVGGREDASSDSRSALNSFDYAWRAEEELEQRARETRIIEDTYRDSISWQISPLRWPMMLSSWGVKSSSPP